MLGACSDQGWEYLHAWSREGGVLLMLGASTGQGLFWGRVYLGYLHAWPGKGVLLMLGASSDQGWEYLHAWSREGGVLLMLGASTGQGLFWGRVYLGYLHAWPGKGVLLMLGASSDQGREYLHAWSREGGVLLMLGASSGQGLFWGID